MFLSTGDFNWISIALFVHFLKQDMIANEAIHWNDELNITEMKHYGKQNKSHLFFL